MDADILPGVLRFTTKIAAKDIQVCALSVIKPLDQLWQDSASRDASPNGNDTIQRPSRHNTLRRKLNGDSIRN